MESPKKIKLPLCKKGSDFSENAIGIDLYANLGIEGLKSLLDTISPTTKYEEKGKSYSSATDYIDNFISSNKNTLSEEEKVEILSLKSSYQTEESEELEESEKSKVDSTKKKKWIPPTKILSIIFLLFTLFVITSCNVDRSKYEDTKFLFFIPVSDSNSDMACGLYIGAVIFGLFCKYVGPHLPASEIRRNIYDSEGKVVGSIGTGEYEKQDPISVRKANGEEICDIVIMFSAICVTVACISSWFLGLTNDEGGWWMISVFVISVLGTKKAFNNESFNNFMKVWRVILFIICLIGVFVYD